MSNIENLESALGRLKTNDSVVYFLTYDTKTTPRAAIKHIYDIALTLKQSGVDAKIIAVPTKKVCPLYAEIETLEDFPELKIQQIVHFFENYKKLEKGKWVKLSGMEDAAAARQEIQDSIDRYKK